jgi:ethanolamine utilization protein EutN
MTATEMLKGQVVGTATATVRHPSMKGWRLLVVQPLLADERSPDGDPILAVDALGAGNGETVIVSSDGQATRKLLESDTTPVRWSVIGICD